MTEGFWYTVVVLLLVASVVYLYRFFALWTPRYRARIEVERIRWLVHEGVLAIALYFFLLLPAAVVGVQLAITAAVGRFRELHVDDDSLVVGWAERGFLPALPLDTAFLWVQPLIAVATVTLVFIFATRIVRSPPSALGVSRPWLRDAPRVVVLGLGLILPMSVVAWGWQVLLWLIGVDAPTQALVDQFIETVSSGTRLDVLAVAFAAVVLAPIVEELLFRGLIYGALRRRFGPWSATVLTSAAFSSIHFNLVASVPIFFLSCALCGAYEKRGRLYDAMLLHAVYNASSLVMLAKHASS